MSSHLVSVRYAKSLIELSQEQNSLEKVKNDMLLFTKTIRANHELFVMLKKPIIPAYKKKNILKALFEHKVEPITIKAFELIISRGRENLLDQIAVEFINEYNTIKGIAVAMVITPYVLDADQRKEINKIVADMTGLKVDLIEKVDTSLIGGIVLKIGDLQIDESVKSKLAKIQRALVA